MFSKLGGFARHHLEMMILAELLNSLALVPGIIYLPT